MTADTRTLEEMPLMSPDILKCPYHFDKTLREQAPVHVDPTTGIYIVSTYDLVREVQKAKGIFSNEFGLALGAGRELDPELVEVMKDSYDIGKGTLLTIDDPEHGHFRDAVKDFFLAPNIASYEPWIKELAEDLAQKLAGKTECNFIEEFARPLPLSVIMHVLGMPLEIFDKAFQWTLDNVAVLSQMVDKDALIAAQKGVAEEYDWFVGALNERRGDNHKGDLLSLVANAKYLDRDLTIEEQLSFCTQFLVAGNETTTATLAEGMRQLCLNPEQAAMIRADRSLIPSLVEESLRLASPTSNMWRFSKEDYELGGVTIPSGSMVMLKYFSSNHDESMFEDPMKFDVTRHNVKRQAAFGFGIHVCIGQHLSKLEMILGWHAIFDALDNFELAGSDEDLEYMPNILLRGLEELPLKYTAA
jgi:cytochrome P450